MAFSFQPLRYGWVALASLVIGGTTIYVVNNTRHQVKPEDITELVLGVHERCLATRIYKYGAESNYCYVAPLSFVRTEYERVYTNNGVTVSTNILTNTITWQIDRAMLVALDNKIRELVPKFANPDLLVDGMPGYYFGPLPGIGLTVTGLWASLGIGDKTNKFTSEICFTNPVSTNWIVNYTSYWPSMNGTATNINYTSDYRQVVNWAYKWTNSITTNLFYDTNVPPAITNTTYTTNWFHLWTNGSNWASSVVQKTNAAVYGGYPWWFYYTDGEYSFQLFEQALVERYKVLNALNVSRGYRASYPVWSQYGRSAETQTNWLACKNETEAQYNSESYEYSGIDEDVYYYAQNCYSDGYKLSNGKFVGELNSQTLLGLPTLLWCTNFGYSNPRTFVFPEQDISDDLDLNGMAVTTNVWNEVSYPFGLGDGSIPNWVDEPEDYSGLRRGFRYFSIFYVTWDFNYCTNKYW
jgi:hypothetical protein